MAVQWAWQFGVSAEVVSGRGRKALLHPTIFCFTVRFVVRIDRQAGRPAGHCVMKWLSLFCWIRGYMAPFQTTGLLQRYEQRQLLSSDLLFLVRSVVCCFNLMLVFYSLFFSYSFLLFSALLSYVFFVLLCSLFSLLFLSVRLFCFTFYVLFSVILFCCLSFSVFCFFCLCCCFFLFDWFFFLPPPLSNTLWNIGVKINFGPSGWNHIRRHYPLTYVHVRWAIAREWTAVWWPSVSLTIDQSCVAYLWVYLNVPSQKATFLNCQFLHVTDSDFAWKFQLKLLWECIQIRRRDLVQHNKKVWYVNKKIEIDVDSLLVSRISFMGR